MKKKQWLLIPLCLVLLAAAYFLLRSRIPQRWYTADELGISQQQSALDADGDGVDDWKRLPFIQCGKSAGNHGSGAVRRASGR